MSAITDKALLVFRQAMLPHILPSNAHLSAALEAVLPHIPASQPVAFKYRWKIDGEYVNWRYSDASNYHRSLSGFEEFPLYATPQPQPAPAPAEQAPTVAVPDETATILRAITQARGALRLDAMVDDAGDPYGTTTVALEAIDEAEAILRARAEQREAPAQAYRIEPFHEKHARENGYD